MSDSKKPAERSVGPLEVHFYGGLLLLAGGGAAWAANSRPLGAFLGIVGAGAFYLGHLFLRRF